MLTCQRHQGLVAHGEHLTSRYQGWTGDMVRQNGWAPEVARALNNARRRLGEPRTALSAGGLDP